MVDFKMGSHFACEWLQRKKEMTVSHFQLFYHVKSFTSFILLTSFRRHPQSAHFACCFSIFFMILQNLPKRQCADPSVDPVDSSSFPCFHLTFLIPVVPDIQPQGGGLPPPFSPSCHPARTCRLESPLSGAPRTVFLFLNRFWPTTNKNLPKSDLLHKNYFGCKALSLLNEIVVRFWSRQLLC